MRRFLILFSLLSVLSLIQGILRGIVVINGVAMVPDISLIFLILFSIEFGRGVGQSAGWFGGILEDFAMAQPLGVNALLKMLMGTIFGSLRGRFMVGAGTVALVTVIVATILKYVIYWVISKIFGLDVYSLWSMLMNLLVEVILNAIATLPAFFIMKKILRSAADFIRREQKI